LTANGECLTKKDLRLQYSGYVIFAAKMVSVATGLGFQFIIARALSKPEYDLWFNINDIGAYFTILAGVLPFWTLRFVARDKEGAVKTGIVANLSISVIATIIYLAIVPFVISALHIDPAYLPLYLLIAVQIIEYYSMNVMEACLQARIPQAVGYGWIIQQVSKLALGCALIMRLNLLLWGAVTATIAAFAFQMFYYGKLLAPEFKQKIRWEYITQWLKGSLGTIYNVAGSQIATYIFIMLFAFGGEGARSRLGASATIVNVITYASFLAYALYPKLLAEKKREDITTSMKMVLMFSVPLTAGAIALSDSYVTILKADYADSAIILVVLAIDAFFTTVSGLYGAVLFGVENLDEQGSVSIRQLVKSRIFVAFSLPYVHSAITLPTAYYVLTNVVHGEPFLAALYVSIINSSVRFAMFLVQYILVRQMVKVNIPWRSIGKYVFAASMMGIALYVAPHPTRVSYTVIETAIGGLFYLAVLAVIDEDARLLIRDAWQMTKGLMQKLRRIIGRVRK